MCNPGRSFSVLSLECTTKQKVSLAIRRMKELSKCSSTRNSAIYSAALQVRCSFHALGYRDI